MTQYVVGIDGGGTKTVAAIESADGTRCGVGWSGPGNYDDVGLEVAQRHVAEAVRAARSAAGLEEAPFAAAFLGMAGVVSERDRAAIRSIARALNLAPPDRVGVDHDCRIALAGGLTGRPGIVLILGTGSVCYGRNAAGASWRAGGWGHLVSDEGSSYWLGLHALRATVRAFDGRSPHAAFVSPVMDALGLDESDDLMHRMYVEGLARSEIAALAPLVTDAARSGDASAIDLIARGMRQLAACAAAVTRQLDMASAELVAIGGLLEAGDVVRGPLANALEAELPRIRILAPEHEPVAGACLLARQYLEEVAPASRHQPQHNPSAS